MRPPAPLLRWFGTPRPEHGPVPQLLPDWPARRQRRLRLGVHLRRLGGTRTLTPVGALPRLAGIEAVRGYCLAWWPVRRVELLVGGRPVCTAQTTDAGREAGYRKTVFNIWFDFSEFSPGRHRLTIRPVGLAGRFLARNRRVVIEAPPAPEEAPDSDAFVPRSAGDRRSPEAIVAALPSMTRATARSSLPARIASILVVRADQLGDLVVSVAAITRLRGLYPGARLVGLVTPANAELADALCLFDALEIARFAPEGRSLPVAEQERLAAALQAERFDLAVDLGEGATSRLLLLLSGARFRYGFRHGDHAWLSAAFELNGHDPANGMEVIPPSRKLLALVEALAAMGAPPPPTYPLPAAPERLARYGLAPGARYIVLHTGARLVPSRWPGFAALTRLLLARTSHSLVIFTHGEAPEVPPLTADAARLHIIDRVLPFGDFDALLAGCAVFVGNDSGPKHLAALRGAKVVSLHMARLNWSEWGQEGDGLIMSRRVPCAGCNIGDQPDECGRDYTCLRDITPEEVCAAVLSLL